MGKWQLIFFAIKMLWEYGPRIWKLGKEIYDKVEGSHSSVPESRITEPLTSELKAIKFNRLAETAISGLTGVEPKRSELNQFRERVWKYRNPNATPKDLADARLRIGVR